LGGLSPPLALAAAAAAARALFFLLLGFPTCGAFPGAAPLGLRGPFCGVSPGLLRRL
jgi:hypothetical protein